MGLCNFSINTLSKGLRILPLVGGVAFLLFGLSFLLLISKLPFYFQIKAPIRIEILTRSQIDNTKFKFAYTDHSPQGILFLVLPL